MSVKERIVLLPNVDSISLLRSFALFNKATLGVRYFSSIDLARYLLECSGIVVKEECVTNTFLSFFLYQKVKEISYFKDYSLLDVDSLIKSVNVLRKEVSDDLEIIKNLPSDLFVKKNEGIKEFLMMYLDTLKENNFIDEISLIRKAIKESKEVIDIEAIKYKEFIYTKLDEELLAKFKNLKEESLSNSDEIKISSYTKAFGENNEIENILSYIYKNNLKFDECLIAATDPSTYSKILSNYQATLKFPLVIGTGQSLNDTSVGRLFSLCYEWKRNLFHKSFLKKILTSSDFNLTLFLEDIGIPSDFNEINKEYRLPYDEVISNERIFDMVGNLRLGLDNKKINDKRFDALRFYLQSKDNKDKFIKRDLYILGFVERIKNIFDDGLISFLERYTLINEENVAVEKSAIEKYVLALSLYNQYGINKFQELINYLSSVILGRRKAKEGSLYLSDISSAYSSLRKHLFIVGLDSKSFPGDNKEDPIIFDRDYEAFEIKDASSRKMNENKKSYHSLISYASSMGVDIHLSYSFYNSETLKEQSASSVLFETYKKEYGENKTVNDFVNEFNKPGQDKFKSVEYFKDDFFPLSLIGRAMNENKVVVDDYNKVEVTSFNASELLNGKRGLSASAISDFVECEYKFYLSRLLKIPQEERVDINEIIPPNEFGTLIHSLMELMDNDIGKDEFVSKANELFDVYLIYHPNDNELDIAKMKEEFVKTAINGYEMEINEGHAATRETDITSYHEPTGLKLHGYPDKVVKLSDGSYRIVDYKTGNTIRHDVASPETFIQGAHYAYIFERESPRLANVKEAAKVSDITFRYLKAKENVSAYENEDLTLIKATFDEKLEEIRAALTSGHFNKTGKCEHCFYRDICGGKKE